MTVWGGRDERQPVGAIGEDPLAGLAAVPDVAGGTKELDAERTGHRAPMALPYFFVGGCVSVSSRLLGNIQLT